jgi:hypothetical protein
MKNKLQKLAKTCNKWGEGGIKFGKTEKNE